MQANLELRAFDRAHANDARSWRNDYRIWQNCRQNDLITDWDQAQWFERQAADPSIRMYALVCVVGRIETFVGVCGLTSIDWMNRRAEFSCYVAPEYQRQGHGERGLSILLKHGFQNLGLNQIWGEVFHGNPAMKLFAKLGFQLDGKRREAYWKDGAWLDSYFISMLASEWREKHGTGNADHREPDSTAGDDGAAPVVPVPAKRERKRKLGVAVDHKHAAGPQETVPGGSELINPYGTA
ncbi:MAG: GNAT family protein [Pseudomonadota bacterium]